MINKNAFEESTEILKEEINISEYLEKNKLVYDGLKSEGIIRCPFDDHNDSTASFSYDDKKGLFNCFGCQRGGDVINLHYHINKLENERYTRIKAIKDLSKAFNIKIPNMFENKFRKDKVNPYKHKRSDLKNIGENFYLEKLKGLESIISKLSVENKIKLYKDIDKVLLEKKDAKKVFFKVKGVIDDENNKKLL